MIKFFILTVFTVNLVFGSPLPTNSTTPYDSPIPTTTDPYTSDSTTYTLLHLNLTFACVTQPEWCIVVSFYEHDTYLDDFLQAHPIVCTNGFRFDFSTIVKVENLDISSFFFSGHLEPYVTFYHTCNTQQEVWTSKQFLKSFRPFSKNVKEEQIIYLDNVGHSHLERTVQKSWKKIANFNASMSSEQFLDFEKWYNGDEIDTRKYLVAQKSLTSSKPHNMDTILLK